MGSNGLRWFLRIVSGAVIAFLYVPLVVVVLYSITKSPNATWPPQFATLSWFSKAWHNADLRPAIWNSIVVAIAATAIALTLGTLASFGMARAKFFGRDSISFALVLPIAFPGIVTALALSSMVDAMPGLNFGIPAIIIGHATFCVVVVFNNVVARLRRESGSVIEASMDLGADGLTTFRYVTFPSIRTALVAGGLLAFGLSFDEVIVTIYLSGTTTTLPLWIYNNITRPVNLPEVYAVATVVLLISIIPVYIAIKLAGEGGLGTGSAASREQPPAPRVAAGSMP
jgi:putative spermidine/putrescine transport system permease protein